MKDKKLILLIDDDVDLVVAYKEHLERNGYSVISAYNGEEGFKKAVAEKPSAIVLDVMMSTYSEGFEVSRELRREVKTREIPILMLTSVNKTVPFKFEPDDTWLPVDKFVEKPLTPQKLLVEIDEMMR